MFKKAISAAAVLAFALTSTANATSSFHNHHWAAPSTLRLHVSAHVLPSCTFSTHQNSTATDLDFGNVDANTYDADLNTTLKYFCSRHADPKLALNDNDRRAHDTTDFVLRSHNDKLKYKIHLNSRHGTEFKNSNSWSKALTIGSKHKVELYANIPHANLLHADPGHYSDIVTATLFF